MSNANPVSVRPIYDRDDLVAATARLEEIFMSESGTPEADEREALALMIEAFEARHYSMEPTDPIEALQYHMKRLGLKQVDLAPILGARSRVSEVMSGRRTLTVEMIRRLHLELGIPLEDLVGVKRGRYRPLKPARPVRAALGKAAKRPASLA